MVIEELMLVNPEDAEPKRHRRRQKPCRSSFQSLKDWGDVFDEPKVLCSFERVHQIGSGATAIGGGRFSATEGARHVNRGVGYCYKAGG
ncbi:hypothetical protein ig2599ANME_1359 [groundwater metagenome]